MKIRVLEEDTYENLWINEEDIKSKTLDLKWINDYDGERLLLQKCKYENKYVWLII